jgi:hypothetical protein
LHDHPPSALRGRKVAHYPTRHEVFTALYHSEDSPYKDYKALEGAREIGEAYKSHSWVHAEMIRDNVLRLLDKQPPVFVIEVKSKKCLRY